MIYTVLLCDKQWNVQEILYDRRVEFSEGMHLPELVSEPDVFAQIGEKQSTIPLFFPHTGQEFSAVIRAFPQKYLFVLAEITGNTDFIDFMNAYERCESWVEDHLNGLYRDEYYQIQLINNQLADSQRALARSNRKLKQAFQDLECTNQKLENARELAETAMDLANRANQFKTAFLSNMSHDIRTPLNTIVGIANLIEHDLHDPEKVRGYVKKLCASSQHLLGLINDILDMNKIESGSVELRKESIDLTEQIEQIETIIRPQTQKREQTFEIRAERIQHKNFIGDATRLRQVLINILSNAVKYTQVGGTVRFDILEGSCAKDGYAQYSFVVEDNGAGMTPEFQKIMFHAFTRSEHTSEMQGTGLGMAITKAIVELMGGTIAVDSALGKGSKFKVTAAFPIDTAASTHSKQERKHSADETRSILAGMKLLCAEDNELNAEILGAMLELSGAEYTIYPDGKQLLEAFEQAEPGDYDVILMDVQMPHMNGYEATKAIRSGKNPLGRSIPIIAMTANAFSDDIQRSLDSGMDAHISKPIDMHLMEQTMRRFCTMDADEQKRQFVRQ